MTKYLSFMVYPTPLVYIKESMAVFDIKRPLLSGIIKISKRYGLKSGGSLD